MAYQSSLYQIGTRCFKPLWNELFKMQETILKRSTTYHPQKNKQTEIVNCNVETYIHCFVSDKPKTWIKWLIWVEYLHNTSYYIASQTTPFRILYGRDPPHLIYYRNGNTLVSLVEQYLEERDGKLAELKWHLLRAQQIIKKQVGIHRREIQFMVGDMVYLKLRPYRQKTLTRRRSEKLPTHPA